MSKAGYIQNPEVRGHATMSRPRPIRIVIIMASMATVLREGEVGTKSVVSRPPERAPSLI